MIWARSRIPRIRCIDDGLCLVGIRGHSMLSAPKRRSTGGRGLQCPAIREHLTHMQYEMGVQAALDAQDLRIKGCGRGRGSGGERWLAPHRSSWCRAEAEMRLRRACGGRRQG